MKTDALKKLAKNGGSRVRPEPMPARLAFGEAEYAAIGEVYRHYRERRTDPGYQGHFEARYCKAFVDFMGGGHADAVATGTSALYVALAALSLPEGSEVLLSPITDPGCVSAIILNRLVPRLMDARPGAYNVGVEQFVARITPATRAAIVVHSAGQPAPIAEIAAEARKRAIHVIEDCSQAHGARVEGRPVGTFGDIAAFSTMYRKAHMTGASGGVVYTQDLDLFRLALAHADRGKPRWREDFDDRDPSGYLFPALNHHTDEISCAIGEASLARLPETIARRLRFVSGLDGLYKRSNHCRPIGWSAGDSPFIYPIFVNTEGLACTVRDVAEAVRIEGIDLNPSYAYLVADWAWAKRYLADAFACPNARAARDSSFCLYLNENYGEREVEDAIAAILKVERAYSLVG